jgi:exonuclease SbcC
MLHETQDVVEISAEDLAKYRQVVSDYDDLATEVNVTGAETTMLRDTVSKCMEIMVRQTTILQSIPECVPVSDEAYQSATVLIAADDEMVAKGNTLQGKISMLEKSLEGDKATVADLKTRDAQSQNIRKLRGLFEEARSVLHRDQLPAVAARTFLKSLNVGLNKQLASFNQPYTAKIEDDLSFNCRFEEKITAAMRLSGGQKVALAVAMRLALYDMIVANLGLLALDEPTAYLDKDNIDHLVAVLEVVKHRAHNAGMQVIVVTHEDRLINVFDNVIRL